MKAEKTKTYIIKDLKDRHKFKDAVDSIPVDTPKVIEIRDYAEKRRAKQNRLYFAWLTDMQNTQINEFAGNEKAWWHDEMKKLFLVPIYVRDNTQYAEMMDAMGYVWNAGMESKHEVLMKGVVRLTSTADANVRQFVEYLNEIQRYCHSCGISLRTDVPYYLEAMGIR